MLDRMGVLTEADGLALAALCADAALLAKAQQQLAKTGLLVKSATGDGVKQNPLLPVLGCLTDRVVRALREFGMTPSARSRIQARPADTIDDIEAALSG